MYEPTIHQYLEAAFPHKLVTTDHLTLAQSATSIAISAKKCRLPRVIIARERSTSNSAPKAPSTRKRNVGCRDDPGVRILLKKDEDAKAGSVVDDVAIVVLPMVAIPKTYKILAEMSWHRESESAMVKVKPEILPDRVSPITPLQYFVLLTAAVVDFRTDTFITATQESIQRDICKCYPSDQLTIRIVLIIVHIGHNGIVFIQLVVLERFIDILFSAPLDLPRNDTIFTIPKKYWVRIPDIHAEKQEEDQVLGQHVEDVECRL